MKQSLIIMYWNNSILEEMAIYQKQSRDLMKVQLKFQWHSSRKWGMDLQIYVEAQKTQDSQSNPKKKEQCWEYRHAGSQIVVQSNGNKISMVLEQKKTYR